MSDHRSSASLPGLPDGQSVPIAPLEECPRSKAQDRAVELARKVAAYKPDTIETIRVPANSLADRRSLSGMLVGRVGRLDVPPDVVLIGREFGDCDDGAIPPMLARLMGIGFVGLIHAIEVNGPDIRLQRRCDGVLESILHDRPMLASVTNDKSNRLRHPLMKNAMQARSAVIGQCVGEWSDSGTALWTASPLREVRLEGKCHILTGDLRVQTKKLAGLLREGIAT